LNSVGFSTKGYNFFIVKVLKMAIREIVTVPAPVLRRKARKVTDFNAEVQSLIDDMVETMRDAPGVGLAATQVGVPMRVIVVEYSEEMEPVAEQARQPENEGKGHHDNVADHEADPAQNPEGKKKPTRLYTMVNPEVTRISEETITGAEGCLSIPGFAGEVERPVEITLRGQNRYGQPMRVKAKDWLARIFLHEIDHLEGVLFTDRAERVWKLEEGEEPPLD
jgi:peptide deformylase